MPDPSLSASARRVTLTVPGERRSIGIVRLFVGGLAARLDLGYEAMADVQLALETVLSTAMPGPELTLEAQLDGDTVSFSVGPFDRDPLQPGELAPQSLELGRMLSALVAGVESTSREDGCWLRLDVRTPAGSETA